MHCASFAGELKVNSPLTGHPGAAKLPSSTMQIEDRPRRVRFGHFEFDPVAGELYREGHRVQLQEQPRQILAMLLERPGEIATREQFASGSGRPIRSSTSSTV